MATQNVVVGQEIDDSDPPAFRCCGASHVPLLHTCTSPFVSTAAQKVVVAHDTTLTDDRTPGSINWVLDHAPILGADAAPSVAAHEIEHRRAIATTRVK